MIRPIIVQSARNVSLGVVGVVLDVSFVSELAVQALNDSNNTTSLYLVDEGGYVAGASVDIDSSNTTSFMGAWQPNLFNQLVNISIFKKEVITGYHKRLCTSTESTEGGREGMGSAGSRITVSDK